MIDSDKMRERRSRVLISSVHLSNNGSILLTVLLSAFILSVMLSIIAQQVVSVNNDNNNSKIKIIAFEVRDYIYDLVSNNESWKKTINQQGNGFDCLIRPDLSCTTDPLSGREGYSLFQLIQADGTPAFDKPDKKPGFDYQGNPCIGADQVEGSDSCPFGIIARWVRDCGNISPCVNPFAKVEILIFYKAIKNLFPIHSSNLSFTKIKNAFSDNIIWNQTYYPAVQQNIKWDSTLRGWTNTIDY